MLKISKPGSPSLNIASEETANQTVSTNEECVDVAQFTKSDGTIVKAHKRCIDKVTREETITPLDEGVTAEEIIAAIGDDSSPEVVVDNSIDEEIQLAIERNNGNELHLTSDGQRSELYDEILSLVEGDEDIAIAIKAHTYTDEFKEYFGDWQDQENEDKSAVVNEQGEPLIVYHGSPDEIRTFDARYGGETTANNDHGAFFFTDSYTVAEDYSRQGFIRRWEGQDVDDIIEFNDDHPFTEEQLEALREDSAAIYEIAEENLKVIPVFLNARDLYEKDYRGDRIDTEITMREVDFVKNQNDPDSEFWHDYLEIDESYVEDFREEIEERARENQDLSESDDIEDYMFDGARDEIFDENGIFPEVKQLDGLVLRNTIDDIGEASALVMDEYIAIDPEQIKSIFNGGEFSNHNQNIYGSRLHGITFGTQFEGMTVREIIEIEDGRELLKSNNYF